MISIRSEYAYPLPSCGHDGALCEYPDGTRQCWRCWREAHALAGERIYAVNPPHRCECGIVMRDLGFKRCYACRHAKVPA